VSVALKSLLSFIVSLVLFEGMVSAFRLLNLPSNRAVVEGIGLLLLMVVAGWIAFRGIWRQRSV